MKRTVINSVNTVLYLAIILTGALLSISPATTQKQLPWLSGNIIYPAEYSYIFLVIIVIMMLGIYTVYQFGPFGGGLESKDVTDRVGVRYMVFLLGGLGWVLASHFGNVWLSACFTAVMMLMLIDINYRIKDLNLTMSGKASVSIFGILYGLIVLQMIGEVGDVLISLKWDGFGITTEAWLCVVILIGAIITAMITVSDKKALPALTMIFLYIGLIVRHANGFDYKYPVAMAFMLLGISVISLALSYTYYEKDFIPIEGRRNKNENYL